MFLSTRDVRCRGGTGLKTAFVSVCDNDTPNRFLKFFASLHERYECKMPPKLVIPILG
jgi:hypothetical protein